MSENCTSLVTGSFDSHLVPAPVDYAVILPPNYSKQDSLPLLLHLHGLGEDRNFLILMEPLYQQWWEENIIPPMVVVSFSAGISRYLNYRDGSERWEDFTFEFKEFIAATYRTRPEREYNYIAGLSMGGIGSLRMGLKYPDQFGAVASTGAVIDPAFIFEDIHPRYPGTLNVPPEVQSKRLGNPVDESYFQANNHANIAQDNAQAIRASGLKIYIEAGDHDFLNAHDGGEFLHRILWENRIEHEYRLLHGCDHIGSSLIWRFRDLHQWLGRVSLQLIEQSGIEHSLPKLEDNAYLQWRINGCVGPMPTDADYHDLFDDAWITLSRDLAASSGLTHVDKPLEGVFRKILHK